MSSSGLCDSLAVSAGLLVWCFYLILFSKLLEIGNLLACSVRLAWIDCLLPPALAAFTILSSLFLLEFELMVMKLMLLLGVMLVFEWFILSTRICLILFSFSLPSISLRLSSSSFTEIRCLTDPPSFELQWMVFTRPNGRLLRTFFLSCRLML